MILIDAEKALQAVPEDKRPRGVRRVVPFFLALEEWVARRMPADEYFFSWTTPPSVIMGRNQDASAEIDAGYCLSHNIGVYRRRSGGGCVYSDGDNLMLSFIMPGSDVGANFSATIQRIAGFLHSLGIDAEATGRNDVLVGGRKVSGSAFYRLPDRSIVHATMLVDTDMENMLNAITPSQSKLASHGVKSVEGRITTLRHFIPTLTVGSLAEAAAGHFTNRAYVPTAADLAEAARLLPRHKTIHERRE